MACWTASRSLRSVLFSIQGISLRGSRNSARRAAWPFELSEFLAGNQPWVRQQQIVQESDDYVVLKLLPSRRPNREELAAVEVEMARLLESEVRFQVDLLQSIPIERRGRFRESRSHPYSNYDDPRAGPYAGLLVDKTVSSPLLGAVHSVKRNIKQSGPVYALANES